MVRRTGDDARRVTGLRPRALSVNDGRIGPPSAGPTAPGDTPRTLRRRRRANDRRLRRKPRDAISDRSVIANTRPGLVRGAGARWQACRCRRHRCRRSAVHEGSSVHAATREPVARSAVTPSGLRRAWPPIGRPFQPGQSGNPGGRPNGVARAFRDAMGSPEEPRSHVGPVGRRYVNTFTARAMTSPRMPSETIA